MCRSRGKAPTISFRQIPLKPLYPSLMIYRTRPSCRRTEGMLPRTSAPSTRATPRPSGRVHRARIPHSLFCAHTLAPTLAETCERRYRQGNAVRALARIGRAIDVCTRAVHASSSPFRTEIEFQRTWRKCTSSLHVHVFTFQVRRTIKMSLRPHLTL